MSKFGQKRDKIVAGILSVLGIGTLTSCYGMMPPREGLRYIEGNVLGMVDGNETAPLSNILVTDLKSGESCLTDSNGHYQIMSWDKNIKNINILLEDIDSTENGRFKSKELALCINDSAIGKADIVLDDITLETD